MGKNDSRKSLKMRRRHAQRRKKARLKRRADAVRKERGN